MDNVESSISEHTKAVLLLTSFFNANELRDVKPLTENGYGYFARWLNFHGYKPVNLLDQTMFAEIGQHWEQSQSHIPVKKQVVLKSLDRTISDITVSRLQSLLNRGASLSMALEKWSAAGVWILDRTHEYYPAKIKEQLRDKAPAILFGVGNPKLLSQKSIGFVGSRDCQQEDMDATNHYVKQINDAGFQVVSGGAKGIDTHAMLSSLNNGNAAIGIVAESLFKNSASSQWRPHLKSQKLVLISPFYPESRFSPANAMQRNKFIYLLSQATVVICSTVSNQKKSGTWEGAIENLKNDWVPLLVSNHKQPNHAGNQALLSGTMAKLQHTAKQLSLSDSTENIEALIRGNSSAPSITTATASEADQTSLSANFEVEPSKSQVADTTSPSETTTYAKSSESAVSVQETDPEVLRAKLESIRQRSEVQMDFITDSHNEPVSNATPSAADEGFDSRVHQTENNDQSTLTAKQEKLLSMSLISSFYHQLGSIYQQHLGRTGIRYIDISLIEQNFPEFQLLGKKALDNLLKQLVEHDLLTRPNPKKKQFCFPATYDCLSNETKGQTENIQAQIRVGS